MAALASMDDTTPIPARPEDGRSADDTRPVFVTTRWTAVVAARDEVSPESGEALESLCRAYWYPLYAYVRRLGHQAADAQDLTQEFFARLLEKRWLASADREKGRFRTFLIVALKRFLANEWDRVHREKRGGHAPHLSLDTGLAEARYHSEPALELPADRIYERRWALTLLENAMSRLREEYARGGKHTDFDRLKVFLTADKAGIAYAEVARDLGTTEGAARVAVHRLRRRFREVFREEVAHTVAASEDVDEEMRHLLTALAG
jgi:RNA polymerase sigma-70 factor (ECF subfamily)